MKDTAFNLQSLSSTMGAGGILDIFYDCWKFKIMESVRLFNAMSQLWQCTYSSSLKNGYIHPYGEFDFKKGYFYVDRVCYRVPDLISKSLSINKSLQRSLTPHLDCCPSNMFNSTKKFPKWRPIQCFLSLTKNIGENTGK